MVDKKECDRCKNKFDLDKMITKFYKLIGLGGKLYPIERCTCALCAGVYRKLEKDSAKAVQVYKDTKEVIQEIKKLQKNMK